MQSSGLCRRHVSFSSHARVFAGSALPKASMGLKPGTFQPFWACFPHSACLRQRVNLKACERTLKEGSRLVARPHQGPCYSDKNTTKFGAKDGYGGVKLVLTQAAMLHVSWSVAPLCPPPLIMKPSTTTSPAPNPKQGPTRASLRVIWSRFGPCFGWGCKGPMF